VTIDLGGEIGVDENVDPVQTGVSGNVIIRMNSGDDIVSVTAAIGSESRIRHLNIATYAGNDTVIVSTTDVSGNVIVSTGDGHDSLDLIDVVSGRALNVAMGNGDDVFKMSTADLEAPASNAAGSAVISTGDGHDTVAMFDFVTKFNTVITTGGGNDSISVEFADALDFVVNAGSGNNSIAITDLALGDDLVVTAGSGDDEIAVSRVDAEGKRFWRPCAEVMLSGSANRRRQPAPHRRLSHRSIWLLRPRPQHDHRPDAGGPQAPRLWLRRLPLPPQAGS
jgi:hypothetical protein